KSLGNAHRMLRLEAQELRVEHGHARVGQAREGLAQERSLVEHVVGRHADARCRGEPDPDRAKPRLGGDADQLRRCRVEDGQVSEGEPPVERGHRRRLPRRGDAGMAPSMTSPSAAGPPLRIAGAADGPLSGLTFVAKDLFDVAGHPTGGGNPDWARWHPIPTRHAWAVRRLLDAGATLIGKTVTDEVSLGILGENPFDGTPLNPTAPGHVPGGSSSGSASAVAQGLCDTALGTDTGGSVRVPASFCGLIGIRPTHGRLDLRGMLTQAPSSDTTGWFARDGATFA